MGKEGWKQEKRKKEQRKKMTLVKINKANFHM